MADRSEVLELLHIADMTRNEPRLKELHDHAMKQLAKANEEHKPKPVKAAEEEAPAQRPTSRPFARPPLQVPTPPSTKEGEVA